MYRCNSFIVDLRHKFTIRNMNEISVFVQFMVIYDLWSCQKVTDALIYLLDNIYFRFGSKLLLDKM